MTNKILRIVAVRLENGNEYPVDDNYLRRYLELRDIESITPMFGLSPYQMRDELALMRWALRQKKSNTNTKNAAGPKKPVTKAQLVAIRDKFERDHGFLRGWKTVACLEKEIDLKTLNDRMKE